MRIDFIVEASTYSNAFDWDTSQNNSKNWAIIFEMWLKLHGPCKVLPTSSTGSIQTTFYFLLFIHCSIYILWYHYIIFFCSIKKKKKKRVLLTLKRLWRHLGLGCLSLVNGRASSHHHAFWRLRLALKLKANFLVLPVPGHRPSFKHILQVWTHCSSGAVPHWCMLTHASGRMGSRGNPSFLSEKQVKGRREKNTPLTTHCISCFCYWMYATGDFDMREMFSVFFCQQ